MSKLVASNVIQRVFHIRNQTSTATMFVIEVDRKQYLVTARHVVEGVTFPNTLEIYHESKWKFINVDLVGYGDNKTDVVVLKADFYIETNELLISGGHIVYSQDVFFLGFPFGDMGSGADINREFPMPFIKSATLSARMELDGNLVDVLDGLNNPGFSGGPVVCVPAGIATEKMQVIGVISGYKNVFDRAVYKGQPTDIITKQNSGLIISYPIKYVTDVIAGNPIGVDIR